MKYIYNSSLLLHILHLFHGLLFFSTFFWKHTQVRQKLFFCFTCRQNEITEREMKWRRDTHDARLDAMLQEDGELCFPKMLF